MAVQQKFFTISNGLLFCLWSEYQHSCVCISCAKSIQCIEVHIFLTQGKQIHNTCNINLLPFFSRLFLPIPQLLPQTDKEHWFNSIKSGNLQKFLNSFCSNLVGCRCLLAYLLNAQTTAACCLNCFFQIIKQPFLISFSKYISSLQKICFNFLSCYWIKQNACWGISSNLPFWCWFNEKCYNL